MANSVFLGPPVEVDAAGGLSGEGTAADPLAVQVDGVTIEINGSNDLALTGALPSDSTITVNGIGTTSTDGLVIENTTDAAAGAQQYSPRLRLRGEGWKTDAPAASQTIDFWLEVQTVQGTSAPTGNLLVRRSVNGGSATTVGTFTSGGAFLAPVGSASAPGVAFDGDDNMGWFRQGADIMGLALGGNLRFQWRDDTNIGYQVSGGVPINWSNAAALGTIGLALWREADNLLAQRNGTAAQEYRPYGYYASATGYTAGVVKSATGAVTLAGATTATSNIIPVGAFVIGVATTTTTTITGASGYQVGDGSDADRWGDITGTAVGTDSDNTDSTANPTGYFAAASAVTLTAKTSNFTGGVVQVTVFYLTTGAD